LQKEGNCPYDRFDKQYCIFSSEIQAAIEDVFKTSRFEAPDLSPEDFAIALLKARDRLKMV